MILGAFSQRAEQDEEEPVQQTGQQVKLGRLWTTHTHREPDPHVLLMLYFENTLGRSRVLSLIPKGEAKKISYKYYSNLNASQGSLILQHVDCKR